MAQTGYTPILIYSSSTTTNAPAAGNLTNSTLGSELAINITDGKLFYKDNANAIQVIGWKVRPATAGGTGLTSFAVGDLLYADSTTTLAKLADVATGNALISGGVGVAPSWGKIGLTTHVSGTLGVGNGGTGTATAFTAGSVVFAGASGVYSQNNAKLFWDNTNNRLGINTATPGYGLDLYNVGGSAAIARVYGNDQSNVRLRIENSGGQAYEIVGGNPGASNSGLAIYDATAAATRVYLSSTGDVTVNTGNLVIGTSGKGIDFSATPGTGTSELLADYEEGTWTPTDNSGASLSFTGLTGNCYYTKVGNLVTCIFNITYPTTADVNNAYIAGLPFTSKSTTNAVAGGQFSYTNYGAFLSMAVNTANTTFYFWTSAGALVTNATCSGKTFRGVITYMV